MRKYYTEKTIYEISETIISGEEPVYILMTGADIGPDEQYEAGYEPDSVDELFYDYSIYNGGVEDSGKEFFGRVVNGISYDLDTILEMIPKLQQKPEYDDDTKYFVVQAGRQLEEFEDMVFGSEVHGRMTGKCYIVVSGYCDAVEEFLGVFPDLGAAIEYANFICCESGVREGNIAILKAEFNKPARFFNLADYEGRADVLFQ